MDIQKEREAFEEWYENHKPVLLVENIVKGTARAAWQAAKAQAVPDGFVVVPKEPTREMIEAGMGNFDFPLDNGRFGCHDLIFSYRAMLEAQEKTHD